MAPVGLSKHHALRRACQGFTLIALGRFVRSIASIFDLSRYFFVIDRKVRIQADRGSRAVALSSIEVAIGDNPIEPRAESTVSLKILDCVVDTQESVGYDVASVFLVSSESVGVDIGPILILSNELVQGILVAFLSLFNQYIIVLKVLAHLI